jgi:hypothetical protein
MYDVFTSCFPLFSFFSLFFGVGVGGKKMLTREWSGVASLGISSVSMQLMQILCGYPTSNFLGTHTKGRKREKCIT